MSAFRIITALVLVLLVIAACTILLPAAEVDQLPAIKPIAEVKLRGKVLEDADLSGIAMASPRHGLIAADEGAVVQTFRWDRDRGAMRIADSISLLPGTGDPDAARDVELDLEGVAYADGAYYLAGSHGVAKKSGEVQRSRQQLFRIPVRDTLDATNRDDALALSIDAIGRTSLTPLLIDDPMLNIYFGRPLQNRGVNIEGVGVRDGQLFIGLRGPNISGVGFILEVSADKLFDAGKTNADQVAMKVHTVDFGAAYGVRDMAVVEDGFLLLLGNSASEPDGVFESSVGYVEDLPYVAAFWDGTGPEISRLAVLDDPPGKAEGVLVLDENDQGYTVLILFDGPNRGGPRMYRIPAPTAP